MASLGGEEVYRKDIGGKPVLTKIELEAGKRHPISITYFQVGSAALWLEPVDLVSKGDLVTLTKKDKKIVPLHLISIHTRSMPPPQKGYKAINHHDTQYRWIMRNTRGVNELVIEATEPINGQILIAELPRIVNWDMITDAIDYANANGWTPNKTAAPYRCTYSRRGFHRAVLP